MGRGPRQQRAQRRRQRHTWRPLHNEVHGGAHGCQGCQACPRRSMHSKGRRSPRPRQRRLQSKLLLHPRRYLHCRCAAGGSREAGLSGRRDSLRVQCRAHRSRAKRQAWATGAAPQAAAKRQQTTTWRRRQHQRATQGWPSTLRVCGATTHLFPLFCHATWNVTNKQGSPSTVRICGTSVRTFLMGSQSARPCGAGRMGGGGSGGRVLAGGAQRGR